MKNKIELFIFYLLFFSLLFVVNPLFSQQRSSYLISLEASQDEFFKGAIANEFGVYPVKLSWEIEKGYKKDYKIELLKANSEDGDFILCGSSTDKEGSLLVEDFEVKPFVPSYYIAVLKNLEGKILDKSKIVLGYGTLSPERFYLEFEKTVLSSHNKMTLMYNKPDLARLGKETIKGEKNGSCFYDAHISGLGAAINITYKNYADPIYPFQGSLLLTGQSNVSVSMLANGTMQGTIYVKGFYSGSVSYDNIAIRAGVAADGYYIVKPKNQVAKQIKWNIPRDEDEYETK